VQFSFPFVDVLTIPTDAGPNDDRIVINGADGTIEIYEGSTLVGSIAPTTGFTIGPIGAFDAIVRVDVIGTTPAIRFSDNRMTDDAEIELTMLGVGEPTLALTSASDEDDGGKAGIQLRSVDVDTGTRARVNFLQVGATASAIDLTHDGKVIGLGVVENGVLRDTTNDAAIAAGNDTDMSRTIATVEDHWYRASLHSSATTGGPNVGVELEQDGTVVGLFDFHPAASAAIVMNAFIDFQAPTTDASTVFTVTNAAGSGGTLQLRAGATEPRTFTIEHLGTDV